MSEQQQLLSAKQNDDKSLAAAIAAAFSKYQSEDDNSIPAIVLSYDRKNNIATVKPLIQVVMVNKVVKARHPLANIPVMSIGGGGFNINFPMKNGDLGWIVASDRDLSLFKKTLAETPPPSGRAHSFSDGLFIPDVFRNFVINGEDSTAMVIQTTDSNTRIAVDINGQVRITAPSKVLVRTPLAEFTQDVKVNGKLDVLGQSTMSKTSVEGHDVLSHKHSNPEGGDTGTMKN